MKKVSVWKIAFALFIACVYIFLFGVVQMIEVDANHEFSVSVDIPEVSVPSTSAPPSSTTLKFQSMYKPGFEDYIPETTVEITIPPETTTEDIVIRPPDTTTVVTPPPVVTTPAPEWTESYADGTRYVNESCYSRIKALLGAEKVRAYSVNEKVTVVAKTDTGYYKLEDGSFIHGDYLSLDMVTTTTATPTPPSPELPSGSGEGETDAVDGHVYVFNADTEEYFSCTKDELLAMGSDDVLIGYDQYMRVTVENGKYVVTHTWDFNNPDFVYLYVIGSARELVIEAVVAEISDWYAEEAIKAQAICDYTYLRKKNKYGTIPPIHIVTYNYNRERVERCVDAVLGLAVYYGDEMIQSTFTAATPGYTNSSYDVWGVHYPYLISVDSSWEMKYDNFKKVGASFSSSYIKQRVKDVLGITLTGSPSEWFKVQDTLENTEYGWVTSVSVGGKTVDAYGRKITGRLIREKLLDFDIVSPAFTVSYDETEDKLTFHIYGSGHGVGFSQFGAHIAAQDMGWDYEQILYHYYPGTVIK